MHHIVLFKKKKCKGNLKKKKKRIETLQYSKWCERHEWQLWSASKFYINRHQLYSPLGSYIRKCLQSWGEQLLRQINIPNEKLIETSIPQSWTKKKEYLYSHTTKNKPYSQQESWRKHHMLQNPQGTVTLMTSVESRLTDIQTL